MNTLYKYLFVLLLGFIVPAHLGAESIKRPISQKMFNHGTTTYRTDAFRDQSGTQISNTNSGTTVVFTPLTMRTGTKRSTFATAAGSGGMVSVSGFSSSSSSSDQSSSDQSASTTPVGRRRALDGGDDGDKPAGWEDPYKTPVGDYMFPLLLLVGAYGLYKTYARRRRLN